MKILICSGAGLSAESGIPTFRGTTGLWEGVDIDEVCNVRTYKENYVKVHDFYDARRKQLADVEPNSAHYKIAELSVKYNVVNITTNVDDLLERAGCDNVHHLHGELTKLTLRHQQDDELTIDIGYTGVEPSLLTTHYPVKPGVVMFYEHAPMYQFLANEVRSLVRGDIMIIVGSSENVVEFATGYTSMLSDEGVSVFFVNTDTKLCESIDKSGKYYHYVATVPCTATQFFDKIETYIPALNEQSDVK